MEQETMTEPIPGPYRLKQSEFDGRWTVTTDEPEPWSIADMAEGFEDPNQSKANGLAIVKALNNNAELLASLKKAEEYIRLRITNPDRGTVGLALLPELAATIKKAEASE